MPPPPTSCHPNLPKKTPSPNSSRKAQSTTISIFPLESHPTPTYLSPPHHTKCYLVELQTPWDMSPSLLDISFHSPKELVLSTSRKCDAIIPRNLFPWSVYSPIRRDSDVLHVSFHSLGNTHSPCQGDTIAPCVTLLPIRRRYCTSKLLDLPKTNDYIHQITIFP
jgi:hypothetical protein